MNYWWVNHRTTFRAESEGGYIWAPKKNTNGAFNQTYENLTLARPGDVIFSYANGVRATGVVAAEHRNAPKPAYEAAGAAVWAREGWIVEVNWNPLARALTPSEHMDVLANHLPQKYSPIKEDGHGNQGCYLAQISTDFATALLDLIEVSNPGESADLAEQAEAIQSELEEKKVLASGIPQTEKRQLVLARLGQGLFRQRVIAIDKRCRVTGITNCGLMIASHIKPWKASSNSERLNGYNGLLLSPHVDKLFDRGHISFEDDGRVLLASAAVGRVMRSWGIDPELKITPLHALQKPYMAFHRLSVFKRSVFE